MLDCAERPVLRTGTIGPEDARPLPAALDAGNHLTAGLGRNLGRPECLNFTQDIGAGGMGCAALQALLVSPPFGAALASGITSGSCHGLKNIKVSSW